MKQFLQIVIACVVMHSYTASGQLKAEVLNTLNFERKEVVAINIGQLKPLLTSNPESDIRIKDSSGELVAVQWIDNDGNRNNDELLFIAEIPANGKSVYTIIADGSLEVKQPKATAYSRLVPERSDDYAWENDKVAFRAYGPIGQEEALKGTAGGTLSSGIDLWLKRTTAPVINKWYKEHAKAPGYYHTDHGEGYDPYHVGASRGTGGSGIWVDDSLYVSQNFVKARTLASGPLRTVFELDYAEWGPFGIKETKRISLDAGSNFSKIEVLYTVKKAIPNYTIGISLHKNEGQTSLNARKGVFRHWEIIDGSGVGEGIIADPAMISEAFVRRTEISDQSHLLVLLQPQKRRLAYYAGFVWEKSGQAKDLMQWDMMLDRQAKIVADPLQVRVK